MAKERVQSVIERADASGRDQIFKWYINAVSPMLKQFAVEEFSKENFNIGDTIRFPITSYIRYIIVYLDIIDEMDKRKFTFEVWKSCLAWFST